MNRVEITFEGEIQPWQKKAKVFIKRILHRLGKRNWDLSVLFCGSPRIRSLNAQYRDRDESTDILSFFLGETSGNRFLPGDIVISLEMVKENAEYFAVSPDEELRRLLIHGILHLGGMDHGGSDPGEPMLVLQEKLLEEFSLLHIME
ncbi:MAG: rRNA maturation RNase YbeY [Spirochaetaceae bacterium]|jgi:probable rRNA maturation factor|nr:rRNA maturation RNase YbeY [Spirochaetaceae bacterium]